MSWWDEWWKRWRLPFKDIDEFTRRFEKIIVDIFKSFEGEFPKEFRELKPLIWVGL